MPCYALGVIAVNLQATTSPAGPLPMLDVDAMLQRLPAEGRASILWARKPIKDAIVRLRHEPLTDELVTDVAADLFGPIQAITLKAWEVLAFDREQLRASAMSEFATLETTLGAFVDDPDSVDTLGWITGFLRSFYSGIWMLMPIEPAAVQGAQQRWEDAARDPTIVSFMSGVSTLMAAAEEARARADVQRARDLIDVSFLRFTEMRDALKAAGWNISAFPYKRLTNAGTPYAQRLNEFGRRSRATIGTRSTRRG